MKNVVRHKNGRYGNVKHFLKNFQNKYILYSIYKFLQNVLNLIENLV